MLRRIELQREALHLLVERRPVDLQHFRGRLPVPVVGPQGSFDDPPLRVLQRQFQRHGRETAGVARTLPFGRCLEHVARQVVGRDVPALAQNDRPFHGVFQLADIAGPVIALQGLHGLRREVEDLFSDLRAVFFQKTGGKQRDVAQAFGERRNLNGDDVDAIIQVLPEATLVHFLLEVDVGRQNDAHVRRHGVVRTDRLVLLLLEHAE